MKLRPFLFSFVVLTGISLISQPASAYTGAVREAFGVALYGEPKYRPQDHWGYVDPAAPKGGHLHLSALGGFDNLNPYILKGEAADGVGLIYDTLLTSPMDEAFTQYGLLAQNFSIAPDQSWVEFTLRPEARWHDGQSVTVEDVLWTFSTLKKDGRPFYRSYYREVKGATKTAWNKVRFDFVRPGNRELPLIIGQMPILPKHYWVGKGYNFSSTTLVPPLGSGPYRIETVNPGRSITFQRVKDWWAKDLPLHQGRYNFDHITYDYYRDATVALEAFFAGRYDFRQENVARDWAVAYNVPSVRDGRILKEEIHHQIPAGMQAFVMNTRREIFTDPRVRRALTYAFDFEWGNKNVAYGAYKRTRSYFENSIFAATGIPEGLERTILEKYKSQLPAEVFTTPYTLPVSDGSGQDRRLLKQAQDLLNEAGWELRGKTLVNKVTGKPFRFEIVDEQAVFERWVQPFLRNLERLGIHATFRVVDSAQYQNLMNHFDFDMTIAAFPQSLSPGNEQMDYWGSSQAGLPGSHNFIGVKDPVVDSLISQLIASKDRETLIATVRALDRVLLWGHYVIPQWYSDIFRLAYANKLKHPKVHPPYGLAVIDTWWEEGVVPSGLKKTEEKTDGAVPK